ncbi:MAG: TRAP transporter TatT component family protein [Chitinispirillales bacterium]|jgi:predicted anti-sigma-YlaC factor YlaD|nr:TRAP transporter TatT component family protein [Chitinispirillales bacterium]
MRLFFLVAILSLFLLNGCSKIILNKVSNGLSGGGSSSFIMNDDDPEFIAEALPLALKVYEGIIEGNPKHAGIRAAAAMGFTSYAYAFIHYNADTSSDEALRKHLYVRARNMYIRARDYGISALELKYPDFKKNLAKDIDGTLSKVKAADIDLLYWSGMAWMGAFTCDKFNMKLALTVPQAKALLFRVAELNPDYGNGVIDEFLITFYGSMPPSMGGDTAKARVHFERAVELSDGKNYSPYINFVQAVSVAQQNEKEFDELLDIASKIRIDDVPNMKLLRILQLERVRYLIANKDEFIIPKVFETEHVSDAEIIPADEYLDENDE